MNSILRSSGTDALTKGPFIHYLITRFNLAIRGKPEWVSENRCLDSTWLQRRLKLFEDYCLPSVAAQSSRNFMWVLLFHPKTPLTYLEQIENMLKNRVKGYLIWVGSEDWFVPRAGSSDWRSLVAGTTFGDCSHIITTRLDNDDAIHHNFIANVQRQFDYQDRVFVEFTRGYVYAFDTGLLYAVQRESNPFVSLIERRTLSATSIFCGDHSILRRLGTFIGITTHPGWLQVHHGGNLSNRRPPVDGTPIEDRHRVFETEFFLDANGLMPSVGDQ